MTEKKVTEVNRMITIWVSLRIRFAFEIIRS